MSINQKKVVIKLDRGFGVRTIEVGSEVPNSTLDAIAEKMVQVKNFREHCTEERLAMGISW